VAATSKSFRKKVRLGIVLILLAGLGITAWVFYVKIFEPNLHLTANESPYLLIPTGSTLRMSLVSLTTGNCSTMKNPFVGLLIK
jgi:hypothetical protein